MWFPALILLGLWSGGFARDSLKCLLQAENKCQDYQIFPRVFPSNIEEVRASCQDVNKKKQCISDTLRNCSLENDDDDDDNSRYYEDRDEQKIRERQRVTDMQRMVAVAAEICDENSELHRNFVPHLPCVKATLEVHFEEQNCRDYDKKAMEFLENRIKAKARMVSGIEKEIDEVHQEIRSCLRVLLGMNCFIRLFMDKCDPSLKQTTLEIIEKGGSLYYQCPNSIRMDVSELLDALKLVTPQEMFVKKLIQVDSFL